MSQITQDKMEFINGVINGENLIWTPTENIYIALAKGNENRAGMALYILHDKQDNDLISKLLNVQFEKSFAYQECYICMSEDRKLVIWSPLERHSSQEINDTASLLFDLFSSAIRIC